MIEVLRKDWPTLSAVLPDERPGALVPAHVLVTGLGRIWVDDPAAPRMLAACTGGNLTLSGDSGAIAIGALGELLAELLEDWDRVFISCGERFVERLREEVAELWGWPRVLFVLDAPAMASTQRVARGQVRRLAAGDADALAQLGSDIAWIADTHGGVELRERGRVPCCGPPPPTTRRAFGWPTSWAFDTCTTHSTSAPEPGFRVAGRSPECPARLYRGAPARQRRY
jgi:hypothetical protein